MDSGLAGAARPKHFHSEHDSHLGRQPKTRMDRGTYSRVSTGPSPYTKVSVYKN